MKRFILGLSILIIAAITVMNLNRAYRKTEEQNMNHLTETLVDESNVLSNQIETPQNSKDEIYEVKDDQFVGFINDLFEYPLDYENHQFRIRGHYRTRIVNGELKHYIYQGKDERWIGIPISYEGEFPPEGSIIQVVGTIKTKTLNNKTTPLLVLSSVTIIKEK